MEKEVKHCQGKDVFERMNYLYQASQNIVNKNLPLASHLSSLMVGCGKKAVLRIEPAIKRTICKRCQSPLVPGKTARVRLVSKPVKGIKWICLACGNSKKIPSTKGHKLWWDQPEAVNCVFDYGTKSDTSKSSKSQNDSAKGAQKEPEAILNEKEEKDKNILEKA